MGTGDPAGNEPAPAGEVARVREDRIARHSGGEMSDRAAAASKRQGWRVFVLEPSARVYSLWATRTPIPTASARCKTTAMTAAHSSVLAANLAGSAPTTASGPGARTAAYRSELRLVIGYRLVAPRLPIEAARLHKTSTRSLELTVPSVEILAR